MCPNFPVFPFFTNQKSSQNPFLELRERLLRRDEPSKRVVADVRLRLHDRVFVRPRGAAGGRRRADRGQQQVRRLLDARECISLLHWDLPQLRGQAREHLLGCLGRKPHGGKPMGLCNGGVTEGRCFQKNHKYYTFPSVEKEQNH